VALAEFGSTADLMGEECSIDCAVRRRLVSTLYCPRATSFSWFTIIFVTNTGRAINLLWFCVRDYERVMAPRFLLSSHCDSFCLIASDWLFLLDASNSL